MLRNTAIYTTVCVAYLFIFDYCVAQTITLEQFIRQLEQTHPVFRKEPLTQKTETENRRSLLGAEDWNLSTLL